MEQKRDLWPGDENGWASLPKWVCAQHQGESGEGESRASHARLTKVTAWISDGWCVSRDLPPTQHRLLLHYTPQRLISLLYCETPFTITSYSASSEVSFKERREYARKPFSELTKLCIPTIPTNSTLLQYLRKFKWLLVVSIHLGCLNTGLVAPSSEQKCLGWFRWCLQTSPHANFAGGSQIGVHLTQAKRTFLSVKQRL